MKRALLLLLLLVACTAVVKAQMAPVKPYLPYSMVTPNRLQLKADTALHGLSGKELDTSRSLALKQASANQYAMAKPKHNIVVYSRMPVAKLRRHNDLMPVASGKDNATRYNTPVLRVDVIDPLADATKR